MNKKEILGKLTEFKKNNSELYGIIELGVFGSVVNHTNTKKSDIDIFIKTLTPNPFIIIDIKETLEKLFKSQVDIVRLREKMNPYLKEKIANEGLYV